MIRYTPSKERTLALFETPFDQKLSPENRWVRMAELVPWDDMAGVVMKKLSLGQGRPTVDLRVIIGALLVKHLEGLSDEDTIQYIQENIYAQYFVGLSSFQIEPVFVPSLFVEIRKRLGVEGSALLNDMIIREASALASVKKGGKGKKPGGPGSQSPSGSSEDKMEETKDKLPANQGTLLLDATVAPVHIGYPTDIRLLNDARLHSERLVDLLWQGHAEALQSKPRTYRREAKKAYLQFSKRRKKEKKQIRKAVGQQLRYVRRNVKSLHRMLDALESKGIRIYWKYADWRVFWIIQEVYRQQEQMYADGRKRIEDRLVSIHQPHIRPIKRGKAGSKDTEFGPKLNVSMCEGIARVDQINFNAFNEANYLEEQIEAYRRLYGCYPNLVLADKIYWTRANRNYLKEKKIQLGGTSMGPQPKMSKYERYKNRRRNNKRSEIEGKFGQAKSKYRLDNLFTRLPVTTMAEINLIFLAINLIKMNQTLFDSIFVSVQNLFMAVFKKIIEWYPGIESFLNPYHAHPHKKIVFLSRVWGTF